MVDRVAVYGVPVLAGSMVAAVLLGPGLERPVEGARIRGVLVTAAREFALRIEPLRHERGRYESLPHQPLRLELRQRGHRVGGWQGESDGEGLAEAQGAVSEGLAPRVELALWTGARLLGRATVAPRTPLVPLAPSAPAAPQRGQPAAVAVELPRGISVPSFPEPLRIEVTTAEGYADATHTAPRLPELNVEAHGASLGPLGSARQLRLAQGGWLHSWRGTLTVEALVATLTVTAALEDGQRAHWHGPVPVAAGGLWLAPDSLDRRRLAIRSATPQPRAYVSLLSPAGRIWGTTVALQTDSQGFGRGSAHLPATVAPPLLALLSTDPTESDGATVAWPLVPERGLLPAVGLEVLADALPDAIAAEQARVRAVRRPAFGLILAAGALELLFLLRRHRRARRAVHRRMSRVVAAVSEVPDSKPAPRDHGECSHQPAAAEPDGRAGTAGETTGRSMGGQDAAHRLVEGPGLVWLTVLTATVMLAFAVLAGLAAWG